METKELQQTVDQFKVSLYRSIGLLGSLNGELQILEGLYRSLLSELKENQDELV